MWHNECEAKFTPTTTSIPQIDSPDPKSQSLPPASLSQVLPPYILRLARGLATHWFRANLLHPHARHIHDWQSLDISWGRMRHSLEVVAARADQKCTIIIGMVIRSHSRFTVVFPACLEPLGIEGVDLCSV